MRDEKHVEELERQTIKYLENPVRECPECKKEKNRAAKDEQWENERGGIKPKTLLTISAIGWEQKRGA